MTEAAPGAIDLVLSVSRALPVLDVALILLVLVVAVPHSVELRFALGDLLLYAFLRGMTCTGTKRASSMEFRVAAVEARGDHCLGSSRPCFEV